MDSSCDLTDEPHDLIDVSRGLIVASCDLIDVSCNLTDASHDLIDVSCDLLASSRFFPILTPLLANVPAWFFSNISFSQYHKNQYSQILVNHQNQSGRQKFVKSSRFNKSSGFRISRYQGNIEMYS
jgi:hypothetical protein